MKSIKINSICAAALLLVVVTGCTVDEPNAPVFTVVQPGTDDIMMNYIAIGNSLTAGFMDGGLMAAGQQDSYPMLIARSMMDAEDAAKFGQPYLNAPGVGSSDAPEGQTAGILYFDGASVAPLGFTDTASVPDLFADMPSPTPGTTWDQYPIAYRNLGVPGATLADVSNALEATTSQAGNNAFFDLILRNPTMGDYTMLEQCVNSGPYLVTCWIGTNDVLGGALTGEPESGVNVTPASVFETMYEALITAIEDGIEQRFGVKPVVVLANIPSIGVAPYFMPVATFEAAAGGPIPYAEATENVTHVLFSALTEIQSAGFTPPLGEEYTLTVDEMEVINVAVNGYNAAIADVATAHDLVVFDANTTLGGLVDAQKSHFMLLKEVIGEDAAAATTLFSLDGIHPNNAGYELIANGFIDAINEALFGEDTAQYFEHVTANQDWDPTYGVPKAADKGGAPLMTEQAATAMINLFR